jgi:hypothetical protein
LLIAASIGDPEPLVRPKKAVCSISDANDDRTALCFTVRFIDLRMSVWLPISSNGGLKSDIASCQPGPNSGDFGSDV